MKRAFYIFCFTVLGLLLQLIVHSIVESAVIALLIQDFDRYGLGLSWDQWYAVHHAGTALLFVAGGVLGFWGGVHWWRIIYVEKRYPWKFKKTAA